jgi:hypothetical protein
MQSPELIEIIQNANVLCHRLRRLLPQGDSPKESSVENLQAAIASLLQPLKQLGLALAAILTQLELLLRSQLQQLGVPQALQTVLLLAVAVILVLGALRLFGGFIRVAVVLILLLVAIHIVLPVLPG